VRAGVHFGLVRDRELSGVPGRHTSPTRGQSWAARTSSPRPVVRPRHQGETDGDPGLSPRDRGRQGVQ
jgi:hypothetical protein